MREYDDFDTLSEFVAKPLTEEELAGIKRQAAELVFPDFSKGKWVKSDHGGDAVFIPEKVIDVSDYIVRGELDG